MCLLDAWTESHPTRMLTYVDSLNRKRDCVVQFLTFVYNETPQATTMLSAFFFRYARVCVTVIHPITVCAGCCMSWMHYSAFSSHKANTANGNTCLPFTGLSRWRPQATNVQAHRNDTDAVNYLVWVWKPDLGSSPSWKFAGFQFWVASIYSSTAFHELCRTTSFGDQVIPPNS